jgi:D-glycero-D-manno-heptose 1,7-bisphosphate phosphatase
MNNDKSKCIFLDRDGVLNRERNEYTYLLEDFEILPGVPEALSSLKKTGFLLVVVTNQAGIAKKLYTKNNVQACHEYLQAQTGHLIDAIYIAPHHPIITESLSRKPDSLMLEKAIAKFHIDPTSSWMIGDKERDIIPAQKFRMRTIRIADEPVATSADFTTNSLLAASTLILNQIKGNLSDYGG